MQVALRFNLLLLYLDTRINLDFLKLLNLEPNLSSLGRAPHIRDAEDHPGTYIVLQVDTNSTASPTVVTGQGPPAVDSEPWSFGAKSRLRKRPIRACACSVSGVKW
jgi:hypothetical protein